jgi:hypothetical protein
MILLMNKVHLMLLRGLVEIYQNEIVNVATAPLLSVHA